MGLDELNPPTNNIPSSLFQQRKVLRRFVPRQRVQLSPHVGGFLVGEDGGRERGHVVRWLAQECLAAIRFLRDTA
jgi:hypothetical protein